MNNKVRMPKANEVWGNPELKTSWRYVVSVTENDVKFFTFGGKNIVQMKEWEKWTILKRIGLIG